MITNTDLILKDAAWRFAKGFQNPRHTIPWTPLALGHKRPPRNLFTRLAYMGLNTFLLTLEPFESPCWATPRQLAEKGLVPKRGAMPALVHLPLYGTGNDPAYSAYPVYNAEQIADFTPPSVSQPRQPRTTLRKLCLRFLDDLRPPLKIRYDRQTTPGYNPYTDTVSGSYEADYPTDTAHYRNWLIALLHATGHPDRLSRRSAAYPDPGVRNALFIDFALAFTATFYRLTTLGQSAVHSAGLRAHCYRAFIRNHPQQLIPAAIDAETALNYLHGTPPPGPDQNPYAKYLHEAQTACL